MYRHRPETPLKPSPDRRVSGIPAANQRATHAPARGSRRHRPHRLPISVVKAQRGVAFFRKVLGDLTCIILNFYGIDGIGFAKEGLMLTLELTLEILPMSEW